MKAPLELAPGVPADWYSRIDEAERLHYWYRGMQGIAAALLGDRMHSGLRVLDAGCGAGGFLRFLLDEGRFSAAAGVDIASAAIYIARKRVPEADLSVASLRDLPFGDGTFDLVVSNDVLQHVDESEVDESLAEMRRVLVKGGTLFLHTNGARRLRRERSDWRAYDRATLQSALATAGFECARLTYANFVQSLVAEALRRSPHAPSDERHGVPPAKQGALTRNLGLRLLGLEARWLARPGRSIPFGHTLIALGVAR